MKLALAFLAALVFAAVPTFASPTPETLTACLYAPIGCGPANGTTFYTPYLPTLPHGPGTPVIWSLQFTDTKDTSSLRQTRGT